MPLPPMLVAVQNGKRWQLPHCLTNWKVSMPCLAFGVSRSSYGRSGDGGYGTVSRYFAIASRSARDKSPALPSSLCGQLVVSHMVVASAPSKTCRVQVSGMSMSQLGA